MNDSKKELLAGGAAAVLAVTGMTAGVALAAAPSDAAVVSPAVVETVQPGQGVAPVRADAAQGTFAFDQATVTPNAQIATTFRGATATLCNATDDFAQVNPLEWKLAVTGDVADEFVAPVDELANESAVKQTMTCTCGGNPADGRAIITAEVKGIPVTYLLDRAGAQAGVNTVTFLRRQPGRRPRHHHRRGQGHPGDLPARPRRRPGRREHRDLRGQRRHRGCHAALLCGCPPRRDLL